MSRALVFTTVPGSAPRPTRLHYLLRTLQPGRRQTHPCNFTTVTTVTTVVIVTLFDRHHPHPNPHYPHPHRHRLKASTVGDVSFTRVPTRLEHEIPQQERKKRGVHCPPLTQTLDRPQVLRPRVLIRHQGPVLDVVNPRVRVPDPVGVTKKGSSTYSHGVGVERVVDDLWTRRTPRRGRLQSVVHPTTARHEAEVRAPTVVVSGGRVTLPLVTSRRPHLTRHSYFLVEVSRVVTLPS